MRTKMRWGILGCAQIALNAVIPAIQAVKEAEVVAIASRQIEKAQTIAEQFGIAKAYGSYEEVLADPDVDAVYIPLPNHLHCEWTVKAAEAGKHVLCEKPFAMNATEASVMVDACQANGVRLAEAFMYRYHPRYDMIRSLISDGEIGEVKGIQISFTFQIDDVGAEGNIRMDSTLGGGAIFDVGCYTVSGARLILGTEPEAVSAMAIYLPEDRGVDMMVSGLLEFPGQIGLSFQCGMTAEFRNTMQIAGTKGRIDIPEAFVPAVDGQDFFIIRKGEREQVYVPAVNAYELQMAAVSTSFLGGTPLTFTNEDAMNNMAVLDALRMAAKEQIRVVL